MTTEEVPAPEPEPTPPVEPTPDPAPPAPEGTVAQPNLAQTPEAALTDVFTSANKRINTHHLTDQ